MKTRGLMIWFILLIVLYGIIFSLNPNITGMTLGASCIVDDDCDTSSGEDCVNSVCAISEPTGACCVNSGSGSEFNVLCLDDIVQSECVLQNGDFFADDNCASIECPGCQTDVTFCDDNNECTEDVCNQYGSACQNTVVDDATACTDGECINGQCVVVSECSESGNKQQYQYINIRCTAKYESGGLYIKPYCYEDNCVACLSEQIKGPCRDTTPYCDINTHTCVESINDAVVKHNVIGSLSSDISGWGVEVNGEDVSTDGYDSSKSIRFKRSNIKYFDFEYDFSQSDLDLSSVNVEHQTSSSGYGFSLIKGLSGVSTKTIFVKDIHASDYVCIKDADVDSISDVSSVCNGDNEKIIKCDGSDDDGYTCTSVVGGYYKVDGLKHSAVVELSCVESWTCSDWSDCVNDKKNKTCTDSNNCGTFVLKPEVEEDCDDDENGYSGGNGNGNGNGNGGNGNGNGNGNGGAQQLTTQTPTVAPQTTQTTKRTEEPSRGLNIKILLLVIVIIAWAVFMIWFFWWRKREKKPKEEEGMFKEEAKPAEKKEEAKPAEKKPVEKKKTPSKDVSEELPW